MAYNPVVPVLCSARQIAAERAFLSITNFSITGGTDETT
jgi:hypothetical protein